MYAYFYLTAEYTVKDGEEIDEVKESDCLYNVSIDAKTRFDLPAARRVKVGTLGDLIEDTFDWDGYYEEILILSRKYPNVLFDLYYEDTERKIKEKLQKVQWLLLHVDVIATSFYCAFLLKCLPKKATSSQKE